MIAPTPLEKLGDSQGRPYFLWDCDVTLTTLRAHLIDPDDEIRAHWLGKMMRQAKPDDAIALGGIAEMRRLWPRLERGLGERRGFWSWYLGWIDDDA
ncbi:MAG: hypothetical protein R2939_16350 [Kofleriaceae bacterium]